MAPPFDKFSDILSVHPGSNFPVISFPACCITGEGWEISYFEQWNRRFFVLDERKTSCDRRLR